MKTYRRFKKIVRKNTKITDKSTDYELVHKIPDPFIFPFGFAGRLQVFHKEKSVWYCVVVQAKVPYFIFSLEKILSYSLTPFRDLRYFFFPEYSPKISDYSGLAQ